MKYDPDIARQILNAMEAHPKDPLPYNTILLPDLDDGCYHYHCRLLSEAGYISAHEVRMQGRNNCYRPKELKWSGVQILQMFKDESLWQRAKSEATEKGLGMALDVLSNIGAKLVQQFISA